MTKFRQLGQAHENFSTRLSRALAAFVSAERAFLAVDPPTELVAPGLGAAWEGMSCQGCALHDGRGNAALQSSLHEENEMSTPGNKRYSPSLYVASVIQMSLLCPAFAAQPEPGRSPETPRTLVVVNKTDSTVSLINFASGNTSATLPTGFTPHEVATSPDGKLAAVSNYGTGDKPGSTVTVIDISASKVVRTIDLGKHTRPHGICWYADDRLALTTEGSHHLLVLDPHTARVLTAVQTGQEVSHQVAVAPDGHRAFVANIGSGSVTVVDLRAGSKLKDVPTGRGAEGIAVRPDGREVWVGNRDDGSISVIDAGSLEVSAKIPCRGMPIRVAFEPDGRRAFVTAAVTGEIVVLDVPGRKEVLRRKLQVEPAPVAARRSFARLAPGSPMPVGLILSADGKTVVVAATMADKVAVLDAETLAIRKLVGGGGEPDGLALSPVSVLP